jgi:predicted amidohydrolase YtcJ
MSEKTTIFAARKVITVSPSRPQASHVAVRDNRILGVGDLEELAGWGPFDLDEQFHDKIVVPGFVEGHSHVLEGSLWDRTYVGFFDRTDPDGHLWPGARSTQAVIERLRQAEQKLEDADHPLVGWGYDPIYFGNRRMTRQGLDEVSRTRPVLVLHASGHMLFANSLILERAGVTAETDVHGIVKGEDGEPTGELQEIATLFMAFEAAGTHPFEDLGTARAIRAFGRSAQRAGVTTATDLYNPLTEQAVANLHLVTSEPDYPIRLLPAYASLSASADDGIRRVESLIPQTTDKLRFGLVKMMTDGSIQGFTARLKWPGYFNGAPNGIWNAPPEELKRTLLAYHRAGLQLHIHTNGDEASELMIDAIDEALASDPRPDHRHTLQHCQMMTEAMLRRAATLGICVNMFANHIYYWGEEHLAVTMGPERAHRIEPFASARRLGVPFAMHSDAPITPLAPLFTAWCAVNRTTATGRVLGEEERIDAGEALRAITLGAAYTLKMDHLVGSIESGKFADFTVLDQDPLAVAPEHLKDIGIRATVLGGKVFPVPGAT